jgi:RNA polymerase sigma-70 factor (ECF subfamily)
MRLMNKKEIDVEAYYIRYGPMVLRRCRRLLNDEEKAYDAMHEVFVKLILYKKQLKGTHPSTLLYRIATNICLNIIRDQRIHQNVMDRNILSTVSIYDGNEKVLDVQALLEYIFKGEKESTHQIAVMYFVDGMTYKEISRAVGLSISGVYKRLKALRDRLNKKGGM